MTCATFCVWEHIPTAWDRTFTEKFQRSRSMLSLPGRLVEEDEEEEHKYD
jgi:hypothetical protein